MLRRLIILLLIVGCESNSKGKNDNIPNDDSNIMVRVINKRSDSTKTVIGSTDYGIIASRDTSKYKTVFEGYNDIYLNDEYFRQHQFMIDQPSSKIYYTYTIRKSGYALRRDTMRPAPCNNDSICSWEDGETDTNCPEDCQFDSDYLGKYACQSSDDCKDLDGYLFCFMDYCAQPSMKLFEYVNKHYNTIDCNEIPCNNCKLGEYYMLVTGYNDLQIELCIECSNNPYTSMLCNTGYTCEMGLCIKDELFEEQIILHLNNHNKSTKTFDILITNSIPIAGFQFDFNEIDIEVASGGILEEYGFNVANSNYSLILFSVLDKEFPTGKSILTSIKYLGSPSNICIDEVIIFDKYGKNISTKMPACILPN